MNETYFKSFGPKPTHFKIINEISNFSILLTKIKNITNEDWYQWVERQNNPTHTIPRDTLTIPIISFKDKQDQTFQFKLENKKYLDLLFEPLQEISLKINEVYKNGEIKRAMLVKLPSGKKIDEHTDQGYHTENCRRIHLPLITSNEVEFILDNKIIPMTPGFLIEIGNNVPHKVFNKSNIDRVHLIIDWGLQHDPYYWG